MNNKFKVLSVNFKQQHKNLYKWLRAYCDKKGYSCSHLIRQLIKELKNKVEAGDNG